MDAIVRRSVFKKRPESKFVAFDSGEQERLTAASEVEDGAAALGLDVGPTALGHDHLGVPADTWRRRVDENDQPADSFGTRRERWTRPLRHALRQSERG